MCHVIGWTKGERKYSRSIDEVVGDVVDVVEDVDEVVDDVVDVVEDVVDEVDEVVDEVVDALKCSRRFHVLQTMSASKYLILFKSISFSVLNISIRFKQQFIIKLFLYFE